MCVCDSYFFSLKIRGKKYELFLFIIKTIDEDL